MIKVLKGKTLKNAIAGYGKAVATFSQKTHQLAYSAIVHLEEHNCTSHVQALYDATPINYRSTLRRWFTNFGKCNFSDESGFAYSKGKASDLATALRVSPAEYVKESNGKKQGFDPEKRAISLYEACVKAKSEGMAIDSVLFRNLEAIAKHLTKAESGNVVEMKSKGLPSVTGKAKKKAA